MGDLHPRLWESGKAFQRRRHEWKSEVGVGEKGEGAMCPEAQRCA